MAESDLARALYGEKIVVIPIVFNPATSLLAVNMDKDADVPLASFIAPRNLQLTGVGVSWVSSDGASSGLTAKVTNAAGTVLATSGAGTPSATASGAYTDGYNVTLTKGTVYLITGRSVADTDDFVGSCATLVFEAPKSTE